MPVCVCTCVKVRGELWFGSSFFSSTMCLLGIELKLASLTASSFLHWVSHWLSFYLSIHSCIHLFIFFSTGAKNQSLMSVSKIMFWTWRDGSGIKRKFAALSENPSLAPSTHLKWLETPALKYPVPSSGFTQMNIHSSIDILTHAHTEMQITNHEGSHYLYIIGDIMVTPYSCSARSYHSMAVGRLLPLLKW